MSKRLASGRPGCGRLARPGWCAVTRSRTGDRKSTRLNSSHSQISYAVFCLKKKKKKKKKNKSNKKKKKRNNKKVKNETHNIKIETIICTSKRRKHIKIQ